MREDWPRGVPAVEVDLLTAAARLRPIVGDRKVESVTPTGGGLSNSNFDVRLDGQPERVLLRLFQNGLASARKEAALALRLAGQVPVARFLHFAERSEVSEQPYAVLEWVGGVSLADAASALDRAAAEEMAESVGEVLARIHALRFPHHGFFDGDLNLGPPIDLGTEGLRAYIQAQLVAGRGGERLGAELVHEVTDLVEHDGHLLAQWRADPCLVHGDFNPSNILVRGGGGWQVAAVLDWEYALSGIPALDFANLLRPSLGDRPDFACGLARGYRRAGGTLPENWQRIAKIADLFAWSDILGRPQADAAVIADVRRAIQALTRPHTAS